MSKKRADPDQIALTFDLHDLPTAQHRAGLAGLILQIDSMGPEKNRRDPRLIPIIDEAGMTATRVTITFTRDSMQGVFDDLYDAKHVEVVVAARWPGETPPKPGQFFLPRKDPKTGETKQVPGFAYDVVVPQSPSLTSYHGPGAGEGWLNLWRQMLWSIPRGGNNVRARAPFNDRARGQPCGEGANAWDQFLNHKRMEAESRFATASISGALLLGAQAVNAELVPFEGRVDHNLLLHFWQLVVSTYIPMLVNRKEKKVEPVGYVLAIPDVADLKVFRERFPRILAGRQDAASGRTPDMARLDLPEQAGLEVYRCLADEARNGGGPSPGSHRRPGRTHPTAADLGDRSRAIRNLAAAEASAGMRGSVRAVETYHMLRLGNNVKLLSFSRLAGRPGLIDDYRGIKQDYRNPLFRGALMQTLIRDESWHLGMAELFSQYPWSFFIPTEDSPKFLPRFGRDARSYLHSFEGAIPDMPIDDMDEQDRIRHLSLVLRRLMTRYVDGRAASKLGLKLDKIAKKVVDGKRRLDPPDPGKFREAQQRVCSDAYLAMRSKHDQDFVEFFAGSVCSVAQYLTADDYQFLTHILLTNPDRSNPVGPKRLCWEDIKTIAMFAVSAHAFNVRDRTTSPQGSAS